MLQNGTPKEAHQRRLLCLSMGNTMSYPLRRCRSLLNFERKTGGFLDKSHAHEAGRVFALSPLLGGEGGRLRTDVF